jgi:hypothetical protein
MYSGYSEHQKHRKQQEQKKKEENTDIILPGRSLELLGSILTRSSICRDLARHEDRRPEATNQQKECSRANLWRS